MKPFYAPEVDEGEFLGEYQVIDVLGRGNTGTTYHVVSNILGKEFAVKTMALTENLSPELLDRFEAQTALIGNLSSPYIDKVLGSGRSGKLWYCVKDYVHDGEGRSCDLRTYVSKHGGMLSHFQAYWVVIQILKALELAHGYQDSHHKGLCHGNLKPENVLVALSSVTEATRISRAPFEVKLSDFQPYGLVDEDLILGGYKAWKQQMKRFSHVLAEQGYAPVISGIYRGYDYLAPEYVFGKKPQFSNDIYSIGVLTYEMLTGQLPCGRYETISVLRPELPEYWDHVVDSCLQQNLELRCPSVKVLLEELKTELSEGIDDRILDEEFLMAPVRKERRTLTPPGMVYIPAGRFFVGSSDAGEDAMPQFQSETQGFYLDRSLVTVGQFERFVKQTDYKTEAETGEGAPLWMDGSWRVIPGVNWRNPTGRAQAEDFDKHPVTQVTYKDALAYAEWRGCRLPTETEWEYAARGGQKGVRYPTGNTLNRNHANYASEGTCPVMQYQGNGYGIFDMAGNVWEWTDSYYLPYPGNIGTNPHFGEKYRVLRGGCWMFDVSHCMVSYRNACQPKDCYPTVGFRCARSFEID